MLGSARENPDDPWPVQPGSTGCYVVTSDPDALHDRAVAAGAEITMPLHDTDYGSRDFAGLPPTRWLAEEFGFVQDGAASVAAASST